MSQSQPDTKPLVPAAEKPEGFVTYKDAVKFEAARRGAYEDLAYTPVFRASALFFALANDRIDTVIGCMNYWREKNNNTSLSALLTLRDQGGKTVARRFTHLADMTYQYSVRELLPAGAGNFVGSLEVELHSLFDL